MADRNAHTMQKMQSRGSGSKWVTPIWLSRLRRRLRRPMALLVVLLVLITTAIWAGTLWELRAGRDRALELEVRKNASLARAQEERVLRSLQVLDQALLVLRDDYFRDRAAVDLNRRIRTMQLDREAVGTVTIMDAKGAVLATTGMPKSTAMAMNYADRAYFKHHAANAQDTLLVGEPIQGRLTREWLVSLTRRINLADGSFGGVIFMAVAPTYLMPVYAPQEMGLSSTMSLIGLDGIARVRNNLGKASFGEDVRNSHLFNQLPLASVGQFVGPGATDGQLRTVNYRVVSGYPLVVVVGTLVKDVLDSRKHAEGIYLGLALLCSSLVLALGVITSGAWSRIEEALKQVRANERKFRSIIDASPVPMATNNHQFEITYLNPAFVLAYGYTLNDIPDLHHWWQRAYPDANYRQDVETRWANELGNAARTGAPFRPMEVVIRCKDGVDRTALCAAAELSESFAGEHLVVLYDITRQKDVERSLGNLVLEKNALLREVHHRVKNNLQVVTSLLRLESSRAEHASVETVLGDMKWRVRAMALLHESLYRSDNFASIRLDSYIQQMATEVFRSGLDSDRRISLVLELSPVVVSMNQATPCGLIVNELISNVLKHGFPDGRIGMLKVELLSPDAQGQTRLRVSDNGIGLPADFEQRKAESLGMQMVVDLAMQLGGSLHIGPPPKAIFTLSFVAESAAPSSD